jgi:hypothetical protein
MIQKIENLIDMIEKDIKWHDAQIDKYPDFTNKAAHIGASSALNQVLNDLRKLLK